MKFYHGTNEYGLKETQKQGFLLHKRANKIYPNMSPCVYLTPNLEIAKKYGNIILEVEYNPNLNKDMNNYREGCEQLRVYEPIYKWSIKQEKKDEKRSI